MFKRKQIALVWASMAWLGSVNVHAQDKPWLVMADWQRRAPDAISHAGGETGTYGRSRTGFEVIWKQPTEALDLEWYRYTQNFDGLAAHSDRRYGDADDLILTGFKQWDHGGRYAVQLIYAAEWAGDTRLALSEGFRWGLGGAVRWRPSDELDIALGLVFQSRFEMTVLPVPYVKAIWRPDATAEFELRATGLQNGLFIRWFLTADRATMLDASMAYETLTFRLTDGSYGARAVAIGEVPLRVGITQFLEPTGTWFVRGSAEWVAFARHSFRHDGESMGAFQPGASWGLAVRLGARF
jgi:hypothetical protein